MKINTALIVVIFLATKSAVAIDLNAFLKAVESKHKTLQSLDVSIEAAEERKQSGDTDLSPALTASTYLITDKKFPNQYFAYGATETKTNSYTLGLSKKFSTGTSVSLSASAYQIENAGVVQSSSIPAGVYLDKFSTGSLGVSFSQSLWKDFFGHATLLRHERESQTAAAEKGGYDLQRKILLINAEAAFWDYLYTNEDVKITQSSLDRARRIESWVRRRTNDGISDAADLLQAQALVAQRQLQLISSLDNQMAAQKAIRDLLEMNASEVLPNIEGNINSHRALNAELKTGKIVQLEAYLAALQAKARRSVSKEAEDAFKPVLVFVGGYNTNSYEQSIGKATTQWTETDRPTTTIGLKMTYLLDSQAKNSSLAVAKKEALAAQLTSERKMLESESAWSELNRRYNELSKRITAAESITELQLKRAKAEADKFNKGRSITSNVVDSEQQAAEAELTLTKLKVEQRKLEAQSRLFVSIEE